MEQVEGQRFSLTYLTRGEPTDDSKRARRRLYRLFEALNLSDNVDADRIELETGAEVPRAYHGADWEGFFDTCALRDLLDSITIIGYFASRRNDLGAWVKHVENIFREENLRYRLDNSAGVHFAVDGEFAHNHECSLAALRSGRYSAARSHFEAGQRALDESPPATRDAIRQTFEAVETMFKLVFPNSSRLDSSEAKRKLPAVINGLFSGTEKNAAGRLAEAFADWVNSAHPYRHGQGVEAPDNPSIQTTVLSISVGASFLRWLADLDGALIAGGSSS